MRNIIRAAMTAVVAVTALALPTSSASGEPVAATPASTMERVEISGPGYTPPPTPANADTRSPGTWQGPYTYRNSLASKCMDILAGSRADLALAVQYPCVAGRSSQIWWDYIVEMDGYGYSRLLGNNNSSLCLHVDGKNKPIKQVGCAVLVNQLFDTTTQHIRWFQNYYGCLEIQGGSKDTNARLVTWDCHGRAHQVWYKYNV